MSLTEKEAAIRDRLAEIISDYHDSMDGLMMSHDAAEQIMREFALRPVAQGVVDSESGEVK